MKTTELVRKIESGELNAVFEKLYGAKDAEMQKARYIRTIHNFEADYGIDRDVSLFSVPGRSEISGNHTDHNYGKVLAASINLDIIAAASPRGDMHINIKSEGFPIDEVDITDPTVDENLYYTSKSIISGMCSGFLKYGHKVGGYDAYTTSNVFKGSGLSSSAAFEDMVGLILNGFYNDGKVENAEIAKIAQYSENVFFGKPSGLMDQTACAVGGFVAIDFKNPKEPVIEKLPFDLTAAGYSLCIVNTGGNHADLNEDYASVPAEMKAVAAHFGKTVLRDVTKEEIIREIPALRKTVGDRAILRAIHFENENVRVAMQKKALLAGDIETFFRGVLASGDSSYKYLQNVFTTKNVREQGLSLALCLTEDTLGGKGGAYRVHGGGFAGTIQAFVPHAEVEHYRSVMNAAFGDGACVVMSIRPEGAIKVY
mgnify:CR=1 FL=1